MNAGAVAHCDVAIAGGGMVGLSLAAALAPLPLTVTVIEPVAPEASLQPSFDARTTALSAGSRRVLEGIGAWAGIAAAATPIRRIHVSERGAFGFARPLSHPGPVARTPPRRARPNRVASGPIRAAIAAAVAGPATAAVPKTSSRSAHGCPPAPSCAAPGPRYRRARR